MTPLSRDPRGKFISRESALAAWLPEILDPHYDYAPVEMLQAAVGWCEARAARLYGQAQRTLTTERAAWESPQEHARWCASQADLWFRRKAVLNEAMQKLKEIK